MSSVDDITEGYGRRGGFDANEIYNTYITTPIANHLNITVIIILVLVILVIWLYYKYVPKESFMGMPTDLAWAQQRSGGEGMTVGGVATTTSQCGNTANMDSAYGWLEQAVKGTDDTAARSEMFSGAAKPTSENDLSKILQGR
jgi:hypothetical protein